MRKVTPFILLMLLCVLPSGAQSFSSQYVALVDSADNCIKAERWSEAEDYIVKALKTEPANKSNYLLWANLGMVRSNIGNNREAVEAYDIGLATAPRSTTLLTNRAVSLLALGMYDEALQDLDLALETDSTLQRARKLKGITLASLGKNDDALRDFDLYEEKFGEDVTVEEIRGDIFVLQNKPKIALDAYKKAYSLEKSEESDVKILTTAYMFGMLQDETEFLSDAIREYTKNGNLYLLREAIILQR